MTKPLLCIGIAIGVLASTLTAHSLFLKLETYFVAPNTRVTVPLLNGEFSKSENAVARDRMLDVSVVGPADEVTHPPRTAWRDVGAEAQLQFDTGASGTYTIGVSTAARVIELEAKKFNGYLKHDGILDIFEKRERDGTLHKNARERYAKHVKAIVQVGDARSEGYAARLGYPVEIIPLQNPYSKFVGDSLDILVLKDGEPLPRQHVYASHEHIPHAHGAGGAHVEACATRTDAKGHATIPLDRAGR